MNSTVKLGRLYLRLTDFEKLFDGDESMLNNEQQNFELLVDCAGLFTIKLESSSLLALF